MGCRRQILKRYSKVIVKIKAHLDEFNSFNTFWDQKILSFDQEA
jgi:hypothetical protein